MNLELIIYAIISILLLSGSIYLFMIIKKNFFLGGVGSSLKLSDRVHKGYLSLIDLLYHNLNRAETIDEINRLSMQKVDGRYIGGYTRRTTEFDSESFVLDYFYDVLNYTERKGEMLVLTLPFNVTTKILNAELKFLLEREFKKLELPSFSEDVLFSEVGVIKEYQKKLAKRKIQMAFIDDNSDTYYIILHSIKKKQEVKRAVMEIGLKYKITLD